MFFVVLLYKQIAKARFSSQEVKLNFVDRRERHTENTRDTLLELVEEIAARRVVFGVFLYCIVHDCFYDGASRVHRVYLWGGFHELYVFLDICSNLSIEAGVDVGAHKRRNLAQKVFEALNPEQHRLVCRCCFCCF